MKRLPEMRQSRRSPEITSNRTQTPPTSNALINASLPTNGSSTTTSHGHAAPPKTNPPTRNPHESSLQPNQRRDFQGWRLLAAARRSRPSECGAIDGARQKSRGLAFLKRAGRDSS